MIGNSIGEDIFIRLCILFLHYTAPLSAFYCILVVVVGPTEYRVPILLELWAIAEFSFLLLIYYPWSLWIQRAAIHPKPVPRDERERLFQRCSDTIEDFERYFSLWHRGASPAEVKRQNVKGGDSTRLAAGKQSPLLTDAEFFAWAFLNKEAYDREDEEELEDYLNRTELAMGRKLEPGRGSAVSLRISLDPVKTLYRSLFWYLCVFFVDTITYLSLVSDGFNFHRLSFRQFLMVFPWRPLTLFSKQRTPSRTLSYWHRPHTSKHRLPMLFIHGIGIGLYPYVNFLKQINGPQKVDGDDDIGIIAIEIMPVSFRLTTAALDSDEMCNEVFRILQRHGWHEFILVSHSYGSVISSHLIHSPKISRMVGSVLLIDPVSILLHLPDVAYNFTCRVPERANERQLWYFASMDQGVAHTLGRCFFWSQNILWKEDIQERRVTVSLAGKDLIVDSDAVGRYLARDQDGRFPKGDWKRQDWTGQGLEILWFDEVDHAQVFDSQQNRESLIRVINEYSLIDRKTP